MVAMSSKRIKLRCNNCRCWYSGTDVITVAAPDGCGSASIVEGVKKAIPKLIGTYKVGGNSIEF